MAFAETKNFPKSEQYGFWSGLSWKTNFLIARKHGLEVQDIRKLANIVYIDFSKAFFKVPTNGLLLKLQT